MYDLTDRFPDPDKEQVRLTNFTGDVVERAPNAKGKDKDKHVAKLSLKGVSGPDDRPVDHMELGFVSDHYYRTDPPHRSPNRSPDRRLGFTQEFVIPRIDVDKRDPSQYKRQIDPDAAPERGNRRRGAAAGQ